MPIPKKTETINRTTAKERVYTILQQWIVDGTLEPGSHSVGLKENGVSYTCEGSNIEVAQEILDSVETVKQQIIDGEITVPSTLEEVPTFIETYCGK